MTAAVADSTAGASAAQPQQADAPPRQPGEQSLRRFKALVEREPEIPGQASGLPPEQGSDRRRADAALDQGSSAVAEKSGIPPAPAHQPPAPSDAEDRIAELRKAAELSLVLERAHSRPTASQLLFTGEGAILGGTIAQVVPSGAIDVTIHPAAQAALTADALEALRRRLAARGLATGQLCFAAPEDDTGGPAGV